ncbi:unnamed protein product [Notodromas monacha]|uniref:Uncharacterized protein n=1 Tax=Notodromas monacha TaxID=399045 RepID=A0A7R9BKQ6_9CRUS|nr:unnamed protein product [Notodromas monacha]CAG0915942.1 unnamed protein product [Notodromas monacha]
MFSLITSPSRNAFGYLMGTINTIYRPYAPFLSLGHGRIPCQALRKRSWKIMEYLRSVESLATSNTVNHQQLPASVTTEKLRHIFPDLPKEEEDCGKLLKVIQNRADELVKVKNELNVVKQDLEGVNREKIDLKTKLEVAEKRAEISVNAEDLSRANERIARLEQDLKESLGQRDNLKIEIEAKLGKIEELENDLKRSAHEAGDISALRKELSDSEVRVKELLSAQARVQEAESELSRISELEAKLHEAEAKTKDLEKMNQILAEYEKAVVEIERDAEQKEAAWRKEIEAKDEKMLQVEDENVKLNAALSGLKSAEDLQEKLRDLQSKLQMEEEQRSSFQAKYEETFQNMADVQKELDAANARLTDVESAEKANAEIETLSRELSSLKEQVAGLQVDLKTKSELVEKLNTDLAAKAEEFHNMEKNLQSERETGQQHQRIAEELKEQLKDYQGQKAQPNGFGDHAGDGQLNQSETPLKQVPTAPSPVGQASPSPSAKSLNSEVSLGEDVTTPDGEKKKKKRRVSPGSVVVVDDRMRTEHPLCFKILSDVVRNMRPPTKGHPL